MKGAASQLLVCSYCLARIYLLSSPSVSCCGSCESFASRNGSSRGEWRHIASREGRSTRELGKFVEAPGEECDLQVMYLVEEGFARLHGWSRGCASVQALEYVKMLRSFEMQRETVLMQL